MVIYKLDSKKFFELFPPENRNITVDDLVVANIGTEIVCDHCNANILTEKNSNIYLAGVETEESFTPEMALCLKCFTSFMEFQSGYLLPQNATIQ